MSAKGDKGDTAIVEISSSASVARAEYFRYKGEWIHSGDTRSEELKKDMFRVSVKVSAYYNFVTTVKIFAANALFKV